MPERSADLSAEVDVAIAAARAGAAVVQAHVGGLSADAVFEKETHDLVTFVDRQAEEAIAAAIHAAFPDDPVLGEEGWGAGGASPGSGRLWVVDPLDGTTNFTHDLPPYAVSIALCVDGTPVAGTVIDIPHDDLYTGARGRGAAVNGRPLEVSETSTLTSALVATGFPYRDYRYLSGYMESFAAVAREARGVRRHGSASVDLAWVARGRFDGFFEAGLSPWDMAAGVLLVTEAGGRVDGLPGGSSPIWDGAIVASNGRVHQALVDRLGALGDAWARREAASELR